METTTNPKIQKHHRMFRRSFLATLLGMSGHDGHRCFMCTYTFSPHIEDLPGQRIVYQCGNVIMVKEGPGGGVTKRISVAFFYCIISKNFTQEDGKCTAILIFGIEIYRIG